MAKTNTVLKQDDTTEQPNTEGAGADSQPAAVVDPFADVPVTKIGDTGVEFRDFTDTPTGDPRKYAGVHTAALALRMPTKPNWKHERAMLVPGTNRQDRKPTSVYGTIAAIVNAAGRAGIPAYVVANKVRQLQAGNKRSVYAVNAAGEATLPAIGWAEGWLDTAITKGIANVHPTKQAPALREEVTEGEANAAAAENKGLIAKQ